MRRIAKRFGLTLVLAMAGCGVHPPSTKASTTDDPTPACRLVDDDAAEVRAVARLVLEELRAAHPELPQDVGINAEPAAASAMRIELISDAYAGQLDHDDCIAPGRRAADGSRYADARTVIGFCSVASERRIRCSADAVHALVSENAPHASPGLAYYLAHEFGHVVHHEFGAALQPPIGRAKAASDVKTRLREGCTARADLIARELRADDVAIAVLDRLFVAPPYAQPEVGASQARTLVLSQTRADVDRVVAWQSRLRSTQPAPAYVEEPPLPATDAYIDWSARRLWCDATDPTKSTSVPVFRGTHPDAPTRIKRFSDALWSSKAATSPSAGSALPGNASSILPTVGAAAAIIDAQYAQYFSALTATFCTFPDGAPVVCGAVPATAPPPPESCAGLRGSASLDEVPERLVAVGTKSAGAVLELSAEVTAAGVQADGSVIVAVSSPAPAIGLAKANATFYGLPCTPVALSGESPTRVLCEKPLALVEVDGIRPHSLRRVTEMTFADERVPVDLVRGRWVGTLGAHDVAALVLPSGAGVDVSFEGDRVRSVAAWEGQRCHSLSAALELVPGDDSIIGATGLTKASPFTATFSADLSRTTGVRDPDADLDLSPTAACGLRHAQAGSPVCVAADGAIFEPTESARRPLATLSKASLDASVTVEICGTSRAYLVLARRSTDLTLHRIDAATGIAKEVARQTARSARLTCGTDVAVLTAFDGTISRVMRVE